MSVDILQNLLFFLILFLFYNANLFKACNDVKLYFNYIEFVDNSILTYDKFTKRDCVIFKKNIKQNRRMNKII